MTKKLKVQAKTKTVRPRSNSQSATWKRAAKKEMVDGNSTLNYWINHHLDEQADRVLRGKK